MPEERGSQIRLSVTGSSENPFERPRDVGTGILEKGQIRKPNQKKLGPWERGSQLEREGTAFIVRGDSSNG